MPEIDIEKLDDSEHLLDILVSAENVLDSLDVYCYASWINGQIVEGPIVRRHWVTIGLLYPFDEMPDPRAALRLLKHGVQVEFDRVKRKEKAKVGHHAKEPKDPTDWLITITIPRRLLDEIEGADLEMYDDEVNADDVTAAKDVGLDDESQYQNDEQAPPEGGMPEQQPMTPPPPPQGQGNVPPRF